MHDSSNHKDPKLVPSLVRYFVPQQGVKVKFLDVTDLPVTYTRFNEHIIRLLEEAELIDKRIVTFSR
jgi:hypothetical protein